MKIGEKGMRISPIFFLLFPIIMLNSLAQIFMKAAALHSVAQAALGIFNIWFVAAAACLGVAFLCWQAALRQKPISFLHPFCSLVYVFVPALSVLFFQETVSAKYVVGMCCIIAGVCLTSISVCPPEAEHQEEPTC